MNRDEFEHVIRAAAEIVDDEIVVVGSQAILGQFPDAPERLLRSHEVDLYPRRDPSRADEIDGAIGDGSPFHARFGYYGHGIGPETIAAPAGWEQRLRELRLPAIRQRKGTVVAWYPEVHDLVLAKAAAGRPHDWEFIEDAVRAGLVDVEQLRLGVELLREADQVRVRDRLEGVIARVNRDDAGV